MTSLPNRSSRFGAVQRKKKKVFSLQGFPFRDRRHRSCVGFPCRQSPHRAATDLFHGLLTQERDVRDVFGTVGGFFVQT